MSSRVSSSSSNTDNADAKRRERRRMLFGDCALIEIIHLHDCLRGALKVLEEEVGLLSKSVLGGETKKSKDLERQVNGRFKVIWSVFRAHSAAEDEFIWPALQQKTGGSAAAHQDHSQSHQNEDNASVGDGEVAIRPMDPSASDQQVGGQVHQQQAPTIVEQEEYVEDHADEERMFTEMDDLLQKLRVGLSSGASSSDDSDPTSNQTAQDIYNLTVSLTLHLMTHLDKEETQCLPLVVKHLNKEEIHDLVGQIMGKRSSDTIAQIMCMAVQNLQPSEREEMVGYMKQAMLGTFFERWLAMSGWMTGDSATNETDAKPPLTENATDSSSSEPVADRKPSASPSAKVDLKRTKRDASPIPEQDGSTDNKKARPPPSPGSPPVGAASLPDVASPAAAITSQAELERLIRAIASNPALSPVQKNTTIQGLRDSVWKSNMKQLKLTTAATAAVAAVNVPYCVPISAASSTKTAPTPTGRRETPPSAYYHKNDESGKIELVWSRDASSSSSSPATQEGVLFFKKDGSEAKVPLFSALELAPSYHDGATGAVLGCPHYARACKLRHPASGRLYTCRLCCEQDRENPLKDNDSPLDRYAVQEVYCMRCSTLQPASESCVKCHTRFAKYYCNLCHLYDDGPSKKIYHCPFCNVCRSGLGLGIDYRHCMRCNACVSLRDDQHHCINQKLQSSCPICHESMFESTEPLRGLKCGHVLHLSCYGMFRRSQSYTCPLCKKSVEDMKEYFAMMDAAVRMQPMPAAYLSTMSNIHCQDCNQSGQVPYHFVGLKCPHCGSYNTRELCRAPMSLQAPNLSNT